MKDTTELLKKFREVMQDTTKVPKPLDAYYISTEDAHTSEYVAECDQRRAFITGFTGSSGNAIITKTEARIWADGRYHLQVDLEVDKNWIPMKIGLPGVPRGSVWMAENLPEKSVVGACSKYVPQGVWSLLKTKLASKEIEFVSTDESLVDFVWPDRPERPSNPLLVHPMKYSGKKSGDKLAELREEMKQKFAKVFIVSALDEVAWLLNLRGGDIEYNPVFFSYVLVFPNSITIYINPNQVTDEVRKHLDEEIGSNCYRIEAYENFYENVKDTLKGCKGPKIWMSNDITAYVYNLIPAEDLLCTDSPVSLKKMIKNDVEIAGMKNAHIKDCAALCSFFSWFETVVGVECGALRESSAAQILEKFRSEQEDFAGLSFETIFASCKHGALIHYHTNPEDDPKLSKDCVFLIDSGGQYRDGTTDITRCVHFGTPKEDEKLFYTAVLKGNIAVQMCIFPDLTPGNVLDGFARLPLWKLGQDYRHGTGHGVGAFLYVHEDPVSISIWRSSEFQAGMFTSDEPGYYKEGNFGIRIEDGLLCVPAEYPGFLKFEIFSLVPYDRNLIDVKILDKNEIEYINLFHKKCLEVIGPVLEKQGRKKAKLWLERATQPL